MKRHPRAILGLVALLLLAGSAAWFRGGFGSGSAAQPAYLTAAVTRGDVEVTVLAEGTLKPANLVSVGAQASGRIIRMAVEPGDRVNKGDLIAEIDSVTQQNALRTAKAALDRLQAQKDERQAVLALAEKTLARQKSLVRSNASTQLDFDTAEQDVAVARAQVAALDAQIAEALVAIETAEANLGYTRITAPDSGTVLAIVAQAGQTVNAVQSSPTIAVLGQLDRMDIHAEISEADIGKVAAGQKVRFSLLGDTGKTYEGVLESIAPAPQSIVNDSSISSSGSSASDSGAIYYIGIIPVDNPDGQLRTYMTAQVSIMQGEARDVLTVPSTALGKARRDGSYTVQVLTDGKVEPRSVQIGLNDKLRAEVISGLSEGELVVTGRQSGTAEQPSSSSRRRMMPPPMGG